MKIISDEVDGEYFLDIVISLKEIEGIQSGQMARGHLLLKHRNYYFGIFSEHFHSGAEDIPEGEFEE